MHGEELWGFKPIFSGLSTEGIFKKCLFRAAFEPIRAISKVFSFNTQNSDCFLQSWHIMNHAEGEYQIGEGRLMGTDDGSTILANEWSSAFLLHLSWRQCSR